MFYFKVFIYCFFYLKKKACLLLGLENRDFTHGMGDLSRHRAYYYIV
jgi:hypothetical protein